MIACFKIKYDNTQAQNEFLGLWILINGNVPAFQGADFQNHVKGLMNRPFITVSLE